MQEKLLFPRCEVVILTALGLECQAVLAHLQEVHELIHQQGTIYHCGQFQGEKRTWSVAVVEIGMGGPAAAVETERALSFFQPEISLFVGVAGGLKEVKLGDVVAAMKVSAYEVGKAADDFESRSESWRASYALVQRAKAEARGGKWLARLEATLSEPAPKAYIGALAAGEKVISSQRSHTYNLLQTTCKDALAVEMEGHGFLQAVHVNHSVHALVVRGISDLIQGKEQVDQAGWQEKAAHHAAAFAFQILFSFDFPTHQSERDPAPSQIVRKSPSTPALPVRWNIPYARNPFFTGREDLLAQLHTRFHMGQALALSQPQAISGLGGIGKTQLALEYAYRSHQHYEAVLWARAESAEALVSSYIAIAKLLRLPESEAKEQEITVQAVKVWLQSHSGWLLILDNADELTLLPDFLPLSLGGHLLLTTRAAATGRLAHRLEIETLGPAQGALFLLRRAALIEPFATLEQATASERELAVQIAQELGGLPLALDQAGAYLEETGTDLTGYWLIYQQHRVDLLQKRGGLVSDHPAPVATTWSLSFQNVEEKDPAAANLLRVCAFLSPDAIPEEILTAGTSGFEPMLTPLAADVFQLNQAIEALLAYSLVRRDPKEKTISIYRLVQAVLQDVMEGKERYLWAERTVFAVNAVFPEVEPRSWPQCERLLPQALVATQIIERYQMNSQEAVHWLHETAAYLNDRARYGEAESLYLRALQMIELQRGSEHLDGVFLLNRLANLYRSQSKYEVAEPLCRQALQISEKHLSPEHLDLASPLINLARLYREQGKYGEAGPLYQRALHILEHHLGPAHFQVTEPLTGLASLYRQQAKYGESESLYQRVLQTIEQHQGSEFPNLAYALNGLAKLYYEQGKYGEAESLFQRAIRLREQHLGPEHPHLVSSLIGLANLYLGQGKYEEAEPLYRRSLQILDQYLRPEHHDAARSLTGLANLYLEQGKYEEAEPLYQRALHISKQAKGLQHPETAETIYDFAQLQVAQGNKDEAKSFYIRALAICEQALGAQHPKTTKIRMRLIALLHDLGQYEEAAQIGEAQAEPSVMEDSP